jgi:hypothetical protein
VKVGDFNGDGIQDIAVANGASNSVTVLLGNGAGGFTGATGNAFEVGTYPTSLAAGDFNGDGVLDLATANYGSANISVLLGGLARTDSELSTTSPLTIAAGQSVPLALTVSDATTAFSAPTGTATFFDGTTVLGTASQIARPYTFAASNLIIGTHTLVATYSGDSRTSGSVSTSITIQVLQAQTITFGPISNVTVGTAPFNVSATASSGLAVTFASTNPGVCTLSGNTVTIVAAGGCPIMAGQAGNATFAPATATQSFTVLFTDVAQTDYYYAAINSLAQLGITAGCGGNDYCPQQDVTRDEMAIFIVRAIYGGDNFSYSTTPYFTDVPASYFAFKWIQALAGLSITAGCGASMYCPTEAVTRDQMAVFVIRARLGLYLAGSPPLFTYSITPYFADVSSGDFAFPWIQRLQEENITGGCSQTGMEIDYCPSEPVIRGDMAVFIMRGEFNQFLPGGTPLLTQISPSTLALGTSGTFTITGTNTNFVQGTTQLSPIPGVSMGAITVTSPTTMTVQLTATANAVPQPYSILAITGAEQDVLPNGLALQ